MDNRPRRGHWHPLTVGKRLVVGYALICLLMWAAQRHLMYNPAYDIASPAQYGLAEMQEAQVQSSDGFPLQLWFQPARDGFPTIVYFHGNGGHLGNRAPYFRALTGAGFGVLGVEYRGYGKSGGSPSEQGFYQDGRDALRYATQTLHIPPARLVLYGESIGTGVAVQMATEQRVGAVVLQSPYTSLEAVAITRYPWLPVKWLISDRFDSLSKITRIGAPLLLFHGERDNVVPTIEGKELFEKAKRPKQSVYYPDKGHNDMAIDARVQAVLIFCQQEGLIARF